MTTAQSSIAALVKTIHVPQEPAAAFALFTRDIGSWWPLATHSVGMEHATDVRFGNAVGEAIVETLRNGDTTSWGTITAWDPPGRVAFTWHPGTPEGEAGAVEVTFTPDHPGTLVTLTHSGWENRADGMQARRAYDSGWVIVLDCFHDSRPPI